MCDEQKINNEGNDGGVPSSPVADPTAIPIPVMLGTKLEDVNDVELLRSICDKLWSLLDDIDTAEDICHENDTCFRNIARARYKGRFEYLTSDGYNLFLPPK